MSFLLKVNYINYLLKIVKGIPTAFRKNFGWTVREYGLYLDRKGSVLTGDIAFLQPINRHRNIVNIQSMKTIVSSSTYIAPSATIFGNVSIAKNGYIGFGAVVDGLKNAVRIGENIKIGDNSTIQAAFWVQDDAFPNSTVIGNNVNIEHCCNLSNVIVDDNVHIGFGTTIMEGAQLERGCVIAPNSYVTAGSRIPENTMWAGSPVTFVKNLEDYSNRVEEGVKNVKPSLE